MALHKKLIEDLKPLVLGPMYRVREKQVEHPDTSCPTAR